MVVIKHAVYFTVCNMPSEFTTDIINLITASNNKHLSLVVSDISFGGYTAICFCTEIIANKQPSRKFNTIQYLRSIAKTFSY